MDPGGPRLPGVPGVPGFPGGPEDPGYPSPSSPRGPCKPVEEKITSDRASKRQKNNRKKGIIIMHEYMCFIPAGPGGPGNPISPCPLAPFMPIGPISPVRNTFKHPFPFSHLIIIKRWINFQTDWDNSHLSPLQVRSSLEFPGSLETLPCRDILGVQMGPLGLGDLDHLMVLVWFHSVGSCFGPSPAGAVAAGLLKEHLVILNLFDWYLVLGVVIC